MTKKWPTKDKDMQIAQMIMEDHAYRQNSPRLGLFELVIDNENKRMSFQLSDWVLDMAEHFSNRYGATQGDYITRHVISSCLVQDQTLH